MKQVKGTAAERLATEGELIEASCTGDQAAFEKLYRLHVGFVYSLCLRMTADRLRAESLTQDAFIRAWSKLDLYGGKGSFGGWLRRLAVNVVLEDGRRRARERQVEALPVASARPASDAERIDLERAIAALPPGARQAFVLHDVSGYRHREISEMTGLAVGSVKSQLHRARKLLRASLGAGKIQKGNKEVYGNEA